jgi:hypothetical protein
MRAVTLSTTRCGWLLVRVGWSGDNEAVMSVGRGDRPDYTRVLAMTADD